MKIGLIADTHDNMPKIGKAIEVFNKNKVDFVLHAGDYVAPFSLIPFSKLNCDWLGVFGNNDGEKKGLQNKSNNRIKKGPLSLLFDNKRVIIIHDLTRFIREKADIVVFGHSHKPEIKREGGMIFINPGECSGWLFNRPTIGMLDLKTLETNIIEL